jgi:hypothetical protein
MEGDLDEWRWPCRRREGTQRLVREARAMAVVLVALTYDIKSARVCLTARLGQSNAVLAALMFTRQTSETTMSGTSSPDGHDSWQCCSSKSPCGRRNGMRGLRPRHRWSLSPRHYVVLDQP